MFTWRSKLFAAADKGEVAKIAVLLASGRNPNVQGERRYVRGTPLHVAANAGHSEIVRMLVEAGADVEQPSSGLIGSGYTAIHWAVEAAHSGVVKVLLGLGTDVTSRDDRYGYTPLHLACLKTREALYTGTYPVRVDIMRLLLN